MSNGFGFSFNNDDDDENNRNNNPFGFNFGSGAGGGGLGDMLNQFGAMLSGMGSSMNSPDGSGPVNYDMAERIARQQLGSEKPISDEDKRAVEESVRLAELWIDEHTSLPTASASTQAWNAQTWLNETMPMWKRMVSPVAQHMADAQLESLPEEAREMMGPIANMMTQMSGMNFGMQLGHALGDLARQALTGSDFGLPVAPAGVNAILPHNIQSIARDLKVPSQEVLVYIAAREAARQRLFKHVPWLVERLVSSVEEYAIGLEIDTSHLEEATRELNLESGDPEAIQDAIGKLQGMDLSPRITSRNAAAVTRLETLLALVEGWVEYVVNEALSTRIPSTPAMARAWQNRRNSGALLKRHSPRLSALNSAPRTWKPLLSCGVVPPSLLVWTSVTTCGTTQTSFLPQSTWKTLLPSLMACWMMNPPMILMLSLPSWKKCSATVKPVSAKMMKQRRLRILRLIRAQTLKIRMRRTTRTASPDLLIPPALMRSSYSASADSSA